MRIASNTAIELQPASALLAGAGAEQPRVQPRAAAAQLGAAALTDNGAKAAANGLRQLRRALIQATGGAAERKLAQSALAKMEQGQRALSRAGGLDSAVAQIMAEQSRQNSDRISSAKSQVRSHFKALEQQNLRKVELIMEKIEAEKSASFWGKITTLFKFVAAGLAAASSVVTGPAGCLAAGLIVASIAVGTIEESEAARWISFGLGMGALAVGGAAALADAAGTAASTSASVAARTLQAGSACASAGAAGSGVAQAAYAAKGLDKQAGLLSVRAQCQELLAQAEEERELVERLLEYQHRSLDIVLQSLSHNDQNARAALGSFARGRV